MAVVLVVCIAMVSGSVWWRSRAITTVGMLKRVPTTDSLVLYVDFAELRRLSVLMKLAGSLQNQDPDYVSFVRKTNFDYTNDLDSAVVSFAPDGNYMVLKGRFDWKALSNYAVAESGFCNNTFCRMPGSTPERHISFFPLQPNLMALGVSQEDSSAERMQKVDPGPDPEAPNAPIWLSVPPSIGRSGRKLPDGAKMYASSVEGALGVTLAAVPAKDGFSARMEVRCRGLSEAVALASELTQKTQLAKSLIEREGQKPNPADFSGFITSGKFHNEGTRVFGEWPAQKALIENLLGEK